MQQREKRLLFGLLGALGLWLSYSTIEGLIFGPIESRLSEIKDLKDRVEKKQEDVDSYHAVQRQMLEWNIESLPPEPLNAQRVYAEWLVDLARLSGLRQVEPKLGSRTAIPNVGSSIQITLTADATLNELATFLYHFDRSRLMHQITKCNVSSPETEGDPLLEVTLVAEGISLLEAPQRARLYPRTELKEAVASTSTRLVVDPSSTFPTEGSFRIRVGREFLRVIHREGNQWDVERGVDGTTPADFEIGSIVEMAPARPVNPQSPPSIEKYERLLTAGPFAKPKPLVTYNPQIASLSDATLIRGNTYTGQVRVTGWDPADGPIQYELDEFSPASMRINTTGQITWSPSRTAEPDVYPVGVIVTSKSNPDRFLQTNFDINLTVPNVAPRITLPTTIPVAWIGRTWTLPVTAQDPDQSGRLRFSLNGQPPAGLTIDERTGTITWNVTDINNPGNTSLVVQVSDGGSPPLTATATANVRVEEDAALYTYLVGCIGEGEKWTAWLYDRSNNKSQYVPVGGKFTFADIEGTITSIDLKSIEYTDKHGLWRFEQDIPLRKALLLTAATPPDSTTDETQPPTTAPTPGGGTTLPMTPAAPQTPPSPTPAPAPSTDGTPGTVPEPNASGPPSTGMGETPPTDSTENQRTGDQSPSPSADSPTLDNPGSADTPAGDTGEVPTSDAPAAG